MSGDGGDTNRWLIGVMGTVGAFMVTLVVGFQAKIDQRQDEALQGVVTMSREIREEQDKANLRQDQLIDRVAEREEKISQNLLEVAKEMHSGQSR